MNRWFLWIVACMGLCLFGCGGSPKGEITVAYVGKYSEGKENFDYLLKAALEEILLGVEERTGIRVRLRAYSLMDFDEDAGRAYDSIVEAGDVAVILDNTWGSDLMKSAGRILGARIPVITLNGDRPVEVSEGQIQKLLTADRALYLGHDDQVIGTITAVIKKELSELPEPAEGKTKARVVFIGESDYALTARFEAELAAQFDPAPGNDMGPGSGEAGSDVELIRIMVPEGIPDYASVVDSAVAIESLRGDSRPTYVALCLHWRWGRQIIPLLDAALEESIIYSGAFGVNVTNKHTLEGVSHSNQLVIQTYPSDLVSLEIHALQEVLDQTHRELVDNFGSTLPLYLRRCSDGAKVLEWCLERGQASETEVTRLRERILNGFAQLTAGEPIAGETSILRFGEDHGMIRDSTMEAYGNGKHVPTSIKCFEWPPPIPRMKPSQDLWQVLKHPSGWFARPRGLD